MHLHEIDVHEEGLAVFGVLLDVVNSVIGLPGIEGRQIFVGDIPNLPRRLTGRALPLVHVHDIKIGLLELRVV